jgi:hypothetical protein
MGKRFPEQRLWDRIRKRIGRAVHIERIENSVASGTPDTLVIHNGVVTFVEHKVALRPVRSTSRLQWKHPPTPEQRNWHMTWAQHRGRSYFVVGVEGALFAVPGALADEIAAMTESDIMTWHVTIEQLTAIYRGG